MGRWPWILVGATTHVVAQVQTAPAVGVVLDSSGREVAGAAVELWQFHGPDLRYAGQAPLPWRRIAATRTGPDGRFGLQGPLGALCQLRVEHAAAAMYRKTVRLADGELRVELSAPCVLHGRIATSDGRAALARVAVGIDDVEWVEVAADATGSYRLERLPVGRARIRVTAVAAVAPYDTWLDLDPARPLDHSPVLAPGRTVTGLVVDAMTEAPLAGVALTAPWSGLVRTRTAADGTFTFPGAGARVAVHAVLDGYVRGFGAVPPQGDGPVRIRMWPGTTVSGVVRDERGDVLAGAAVWAITLEQSTQTHYESIVAGPTDAQGRFALSGCGYDEQIPVVVATAPGRAIVVREGAHKFAQLDVGELRLPAPRLLRGVVVDAAGAPVAGLRTWLWGNNDDRWVAPARRPSSPGGHDPCEMVVGWRFAATDASGCFAFGDLPPGRYELRVLDAQGRVVTKVADLVVATADPERLVVRLPQ